MRIETLETSYEQKEELIKEMAKTLFDEMIVSLVLIDSNKLDCVIILWAQKHSTTFVDDFDNQFLTMHMRVSFAFNLENGRGEVKRVGYDSKFGDQNR